MGETEMEKAERLLHEGRERWRRALAKREELARALFAAWDELRDIETENCRLLGRVMSLKDRHARALADAYTP